MIGADSVPLINFTSERLAFGPCGPEHIPLSLKWANDWQVSAGRGMPLRPYSLDEATRWNERNRAPSSYWFVMYEHASLRPIREAGFTNVDLHHRSAEYGISIGETDCWNKGYGTEARAQWSATASRRCGCT
jgi:RimJ/RimL family protein N-acetyltransferase